MLHGLQVIRYWNKRVLMKIYRLALVEASSTDEVNVFSFHEKNAFSFLTDVGAHSSFFFMW